MGKLSIIESRVKKGTRSVRLSCSSLGLLTGRIKEVLVNDGCLVIETADGNESFIEESEIKSFAFLSESAAISEVPKAIAQNGLPAAAGSFVVGENRGGLSESSHPVPAIPSVVLNDAKTVSVVSHVDESVSPASAFGPVGASDDETVSQSPASFVAHSWEDETRAMFISCPDIEMPEPTFELADCLPDQEKVSYEVIKKLEGLLGKWRNKYEYACRIKEMSRMREIFSDVQASVRLYKLPYFSYLHGLLLAKINKDYEGAMKCLIDAVKNCCELACLPAIACGLHLGQYVETARMITMFSGKHGLTEKLAQALGFCVTHAEMTKGLLIGSALKAVVDSTSATKFFVCRAVAFLVKNDQIAFEAALAGDIERLRSTSCGNDLFDWVADVKPTEKAAKVTQTLQRLDLLHTWQIGVVETYSITNQKGLIKSPLLSSQLEFSKFTVSTLLMNELEQYRVGQEVYFKTDRKIDSFSIKMPRVLEVRKVEEGTGATVRSVSKVPAQSFYGMTGSKAYYWLAKTADQQGDLENAENYYRMEIKTRGPAGRYYKSAIKDLAMLLGRMNRPNDAIAHLDLYKDSFVGADEKRSLQQMRVQFYVKGKKFLEAAAILRELVRPLAASDPKRRAYLQQEAYCFYAAGNSSEAMKRLENLQKTYPRDIAIRDLMEKICTAGERGENGELGVALADVFMQEKSIYAQYLLDNCDYYGVDARSKIEGFSSDDIHYVERRFSSLKGHLPNERAQYQLTLAKLSIDIGKPEVDVLNYLFEYFLYKAIGVASDPSGDPCVLRFYSFEALRQYSGDCSEQSSKSKLLKAWGLLLGTYVWDCFSEMLVRCSYDTNIATRELDAIFRMINEDSKARINLSRDLYSYNQKASRAYWGLMSTSFVASEFISNSTNSRTTDNGLQIQLLLNDMESLSTDRLRRVLGEIVNPDGVCQLELDHRRVNLLHEIVSKIIDYAEGMAFGQSENEYLQVQKLISDLHEDSEKNPSTFGVDVLWPILDKLNQLIRGDYNSRLLREPEFQLVNVLDDEDGLGKNFYTLNPDQSVSLKVNLKTDDRSCPPVSDLHLYVDGDEHGGCFSPEPFGGDTKSQKEFELLYHPTETEVEDATFSVKVCLSYLTRNGETKISGPHPITVRLGAVDFETISNPYSRYAGGASIDSDDKDMFFGRSELITRISNHLAEPFSGQCFILYGQKRSGKTSVLYHVEGELPDSCVYTYLSAQEFSGGEGNAVVWFADELLEIVQEKLNHLGMDSSPLKTLDPTDNPTKVVRNISAFLKEKGLSWVVAIDEFTAIYSMDRDGAERFMHMWKAFLERRLFNAVLIGQDTMMQFKRAFPNDFCTSHDERITSLDRKSADAMGQNPILYNGQTRYRGNSLSRLWEYTAGSPYFMQKFCSELVVYLNEKRQTLITEADIDHVAQRLTDNEYIKHLTEVEFDALITSGDEKLAQFSKERLVSVLARIAKQTQKIDWCFINSLGDESDVAEIVRDLTDRDTLVTEENRTRIKVGLFAAWLRINGGVNK